MNKILVVGCPGSGKSYFSKQLAEITKLPLYHLDNIFWKEDKKNIEQNVFIQRVNEIMNNDSWIIDGMYLSTFEDRISKADMVIFLDYSINECISGIIQRSGSIRSDLPWVENNEDTENMIEYIKESYNSIHDTVYDVLNKYPTIDKEIITSRTCVTEYLNKIRKEYVSRETIY